MWTIKYLSAVSDDGDILTIDDGKLKLYVTTANGFKLGRAFELDEIQPGLSVAVDDLIKQLGEVTS